QQAPGRHEIEPHAGRSGADSCAGIVQTAGAEDVEISRAKHAAFRRWQYPRFVHQLSQCDTAVSNPRVSASRPGDAWGLVERFEFKFLVSKAVRSPCNQEIDITLAQFTVQFVRFLRRDEMKRDARITRAEPLDDGRNEDFGVIGGASDPHFASARV